MRIHRLEITAFGPFAQQQVIDFDELNQEGIFLLNGPTGSGKSSILDAISFALYGTTSSGRKELKSTHADPYTAPQVTLDFSVQGRRFQITRDASYHRPGRKSAVPAKVQIEEVDAQGQPLTADPRSTRNDESGVDITQLLGLDAKQFNQVMILPQGKFQAFLTAKSIEREEILQKLFGTQDYEKVQKYLAEEAKQLKQTVEGQQALLDQTFSQIEEAQEGLAIEKTSLLLELEAEEAEEKEASDQPSDSASLEQEKLEEAQGRLQQAQKIARLLEAKGRETRQEIQQLRDQQEKDKKLLEAQQHKEELQAHKKALDAQTAEHEEALAALAAHQQASRALPAIRAQQAANKRQEEAQEASTQASRQAQQIAKSARQPLTTSALEAKILEKLPQLLEEADRAEDPLSQALKELEQVAGDLRVYQQQAEALTASLQRLDDKKQKLPALEESLQEAREEVQAQLQTLEKLEEEIAQGQGVDLALQQAQGQLEKTQEIQGQAQKLEALRQEEASQQERLLAADQARQEASAQHQDLQAARTRYLLASLALELRPDQPCPVCGSDQHPAPAQPSHGERAVSQQEINHALDKRNQAEKAQQVIEAQLMASQEKIQELELAQIPSLSQAQQQLEEAQQAQRQAQDKVKAQQSLLAQEKTQQKRLEQAQQTLQRAQLSLAQEKAALQSLDAEVKEQQQKLAQEEEALGYRERAQALIQLGEACHLASKLAYLARQASQDLEKSQEELVQALEENQLTDSKQAQDMLLESGQVRALSEQTQSYRSRLDAYQRDSKSIAQQELASFLEAGGKLPMPEELTTSQQMLKEKEDQLENYLRSQAQLETSSQHYERLLATLQETLEKGQDVRAQYQLVDGLSKVASAGQSSDNQFRMTLQSYVLTHQLVRVAEAASEHLESMSGGRYRLEHSDQQRANGAKSGLELKILDAWNSTQRDPSSLSGGESFMASFALALGLAEIVQGSQGGIEIDTLFVDEGFGSLDDETLDTVMSTIDNLREGGRVVGLISHVTEMKTRIGKHLTLVKGPQGSTIKS